ncbi:P-loop containing nucleoside triphosphate hydrolase protein [Globomyces pollinis-pini]|nr:P-loop containing nucleoside triphosphate hydrolase protein [Globomyces pollinis-pini]
MMIKFINPNNVESIWINNGWVLTIILFVTQLTILISYIVSTMIDGRASQIVESVLRNAIYEKSFILSVQSRKKYSEGRILNMINNDIDTLNAAIQCVQTTLLIPVQLTLAIYYLWKLVGTALWIGILFILVALLIASVGGPYVGKQYQGLATKGDERISKIREMLIGMKTVKFKSLESFFFDEIAQPRLKQINFLKKIWYVSAITKTTATATPTLVAVATFLVYVAQGNAMTPQVIFPTLLYLNLLAPPMESVSDVVVKLQAGKISYLRMANFLNAPEMSNEQQVKQETDKDSSAILLDQVSWSWVTDKKVVWDGEEEESDEEDEPADTHKPFQLQNISVQIPKGSKVAIVGTVGSGKSSFLSGLLGEMNLVDGIVNINGSMAYCGQEPWITAQSIKDNIIFGLPWKEDKFRAVLKASGLNEDISTFKDGINTQLGENGINLSGGQKSRLALGRAMYSDRDIVLLDSPLAALDAKVAKSVFNDAILEYLKPKTVLLATHKLTFLNQMDLIIVVDQGRVIEVGNFDKLFNQMTSRVRELMPDFGTLSDDVTEAELTEVDEITDVSFLDDQDGESFMEQEEKIDGRVQLVAYKRLMNTFGIPAVLAVFASCLVNCAFSIAAPYFLSIWSATSDADDNQSYYITTYVLLCTGIVGSGLTLYLTMLFSSAKACERIHKFALQGMLRAPMSFFDSNPVGRIITRFSSDVNFFDRAVLFFTISLLQAIINLIVMLVLICQASFYLIALILLILACCWRLFVFFQPGNIELRRLFSLETSPLDSWVSEGLSGLSTIRAYNAQNIWVQQHQKLVDNNGAVYFMLFGMSMWFDLRVGYLTSILTLMVCIIGTQAKESSPQLSAAIGLALTYTSTLSTTIGSVLILMGYGESQMNSVERLTHYAYDLKAEGNELNESDPAPELWPISGSIEFNSLDLKYADDSPLIVKNLSASVKPGENIGVCGRTGSGKSTLVSSIFRIIEPARGNIKIDGIDIQSLGLKTLRSRVQMIPQEPVMFQGTIRYNLLLDKTYDDPELWESLEAVGMKEAVECMEGKLDSLVELNGENLSLGQRQLLCLCRSILAKPKILILDEATASVDGTSDTNIQKIIKTTFKNTTVISIAHRLNTISEFDKVMVLDDGELVEFDTPYQLLQDQSSSFFQLVSATGIDNTNNIKLLAKQHNSK